MFVKIRINILTQISYYILRIIGRIPDKVMIFILSSIDKFMRDFKFEIVGFYVKDVLDVYKMGKPYTDIIKRILRESREKELKDLLKGVFEEEWKK